MEPGALVESMEIEGDREPWTVLMDIPSTLVPGTYFIRLSKAGARKTHTQQVIVL